MNHCVGFARLVLVAMLLLAGPAVAQDASPMASTAFNGERSGTINGVRVTREIAAIGVSMDLTFDVEWLYRASSLMGDALINCGLRVRNVRGRVMFMHDDKRQSVAVTDANAELVSIVSLSFLMIYRDWLNGVTVLRCGEGVIAREDTQPFNVASGQTWRSIFCRVPWRGQESLPERLAHDWCTQGLGGSYVEAENAREIYHEFGAHSIARPRIAAASIGVTQLVVAEQARLREEARALARAEDEERKVDESDKRPAADPYARLARPAVNPPDRATPDDEGPTASDPQFREAVERASVAREASFGECRSTQPEQVIPKADLDRLDETFEEAKSACEAGRPARPSQAYSGLGLTLHAVPVSCMSRGLTGRALADCEREADLRHQRAAEAERRRREEQARRAAEARRQREAEDADYRRRLAHWEQVAFPACLTAAETEHEAAKARTLREGEETFQRQLDAWRDGPYAECRSRAQAVFSEIVAEAEKQSLVRHTRMRGLMGLRYSNDR